MWKIHIISAHFPSTMMKTNGEWLQDSHLVPCFDGKNISSCIVNTFQVLLIGQIVWNLLNTYSVYVCVCICKVNLKNTLMCGLRPPNLFPILGVTFLDFSTPWSMIGHSLNIFWGIFSAYLDTFGSFNDIKWLWGAPGWLFSWIFCYFLS